MNKIKIFFILYLALCALHLPAYALQSTGSITAVVLVQGTFNLMVNTDSFDFTRLAPGQTGGMTRSEGVGVTGASSGGNPWYLKVSAVRPLTSGSNFIPNDNFTWYGTSEGKGQWNGAEEKNFADPNVAAYISTVEEADQVSKVMNKFNFLLHVPEDTKPGEYSTSVMFTMTE
ncbi:MAG: hypothetical protein ABH860_01190 [bacterium]